MVTYTLRELSGYYSISFVDLLGMLTYDLDKFASTRLFMPELLSLLKDIRLETLSEKESRRSVVNGLFKDILVLHGKTTSISVPEI